MITTNNNKVVTVIIKPGCVLDRHLAIANGSYLFIRDAASKPGKRYRIELWWLKTLADLVFHDQSISNFYPS